MVGGLKDPPITIILFFIIKASLSAGFYLGPQFLDVVFLFGM
jgi:hypothetical protein